MVKNLNYLFTSESVSEGHPDKVCDQISDSILDLYLSKDPVARVAVETLVTTDLVVVSGEVRSAVEISKELIEKTIRLTVKEIGYEQKGFHWEKIEVKILLHEQSSDIAMGVDSDGNVKDEGAGDQGIMFGYACNETLEFMPAPIFYSHKILKLLSEKRHAGLIDGILPDSKSQVTMVYEKNKPIKADSIVVSTQHTENCSQDEISQIVKKVINESLPSELLKDETSYIINPTGNFVIGGPVGDTGLTGRKIIVDTYGGSAPHGGGAFSGKDPTKVDRSAAYISRYLAKNIVAAGISDKCTIQLSYAIGVSKPLSIYADLGDNGSISEDSLVEFLSDLVDLTPRGIRERLGLNKPIYKKTASYGHFGREPDQYGGFGWEKLDLVDALSNEFK
ncbi:MAG: methionine adenosyltransferase [Rhodobiaceae bacterium]|nr:methionine adenosyltransferase [Rhodobiaceae bacterium]|tara:strand:- start:1203 stop:2378 length:1176 start_codon:yes stop_codon:yes gene_type:complete